MIIIKNVYENNPKKDFIRIFGENFVKNNRHKCVVIHNNKLHSLTSKFPVNSNKSDKFTIKLFLLALHFFIKAAPKFSLYHKKVIILLHNEP